MVVILYGLDLNGVFTIYGWFNGKACDNIWISRGASVLARLRAKPLTTTFFPNHGVMVAFSQGLGFNSHSPKLHFLTISNHFSPSLTKLPLLISLSSGGRFSRNKRHRKAADELFHFVSFTLHFEYFNSIEF
jgi:hypothetical protein